MAQHLAAIVARYALPLAAPYTVAAVLVAYSGLPAGLHTVAEHLLVDRVQVEQLSGVAERSDAIGQRRQDAVDLLRATASHGEREEAANTARRDAIGLARMPTLPLVRDAAHASVRESSLGGLRQPLAAPTRQPALSQRRNALTKDDRHG